MPKLVTSKRVFAAGALALTGVAIAAVLLVNRPAAAQPPTQSPATAADAWKNLLYFDSGSCTECHAVPTPAKIAARAGEFVLLTESSIWRAYDKHAQAYAVLEGARGKMIGKVLYNDEARVTKPEGGCLNCHAMHNLSEINRSKVEEAKKKDVTLKVEDGVSCTGCHGPSMSVDGRGGWIGPHGFPPWRGQSPEEKFKLGMRNLRDPEVRATLCLSCHVGNAAEGKVVTHAMMAAGHPPLPPIEVTTFTQNMPQHWRDPGTVPYFQANKNDATIRKNYGLDFAKFHQTRGALIGSIVSIRETMQLARDRARFERPKDGPPDWWLWPELKATASPPKPADRWAEIAMAHSDCFACHHDLRFPGYRQERGFGYFVPGVASARVIPGRPVVRGWPLGGATAALLYLGREDKVPELKDRLGKLVAATNARPFGAPDQLDKAAGEIIDWCQALLKDLQAAEFNEAKVRDMVKKLAALYAGSDVGGALLPDYETARQLASIVQLAATEAGLSGDALASVRDLAKVLSVRPFTQRTERLNIMKEVIWASIPQADRPQRPAFDTGFDAFKSHVEALDYGKAVTVADIDALKSNKFLTACQGITPRPFTDAVLARANALQALSDKEEKEVLNTVANYDPATFVAALRKLSAALK